MKTCNLDYLKSHSPNNPKFVAVMLNMFLTETPIYLAEIKKSLASGNWDHVHGNVHKIRPSIDLIGMPKEIGAIAKEIEEYAKSRTHLDLVPALFSKIDDAFTVAYAELTEELKTVTPTPN